MDTSALAADARYTYVDSPLGWLEVWAATQGVMRLSFRGDEPPAPRTRQDGVLYMPAPADHHTMLRAALFWLSAYFDAPWEAPPPPPIHLRHPDAFSGRILTTLHLQVPLGGVVSYRQLAQLAGEASAVRAVGQVMAANPLPLIVPCHRVVRSSGRLGEYAGPDGASTKAWLLGHEDVPLEQGRTGMWVDMDH